MLWTKTFRAYQKIPFAILVLFVLLALSQSGCSTYYRVSVNSYSGTALVGDLKFVIMSGMKDVKENDLEFKEYAAYLEKILLKKGMSRVRNLKNADVAILLAYGIGNPETSYVPFSVPVYGQTGIGSATTTGTISTYGNYSSYSGTTTYSPTYGVVGKDTTYIPVSRFTRFVQITAYDYNSFKKNNQEEQLWKTDIVSSGRNGDLREVVPYMLAASRDLIGTSTGKAVEVTINEGDEEVETLKGN